MPDTASPETAAFVTAAAECEPSAVRALAAPADLADPAIFAAAALPAYGLSPTSPPLLVNRSENATFRVEAGGRVAALRVHRPGYHSRAAIESELAWAAALRADAGIVTPRPIPARDGRLVTEVAVDGDVRQVVLFEWLPGREPADAEYAGRFEQLGELTARMHEHALTWRPPAGFTRFRWDEPALLGPAPRWGRWADGIGVGPAEVAVLDAAADLVRRRLHAYGTPPERFGLAHADLRAANLLVDGDDGADIAVIDFDDSGHTWRFYDAATAVSFREHDPRVPEWMDAWSRGYRGVRALPAADAAELPTFVMLRRLVLVAWLGSHADTELAGELGAPFTAQACALAENFLSSDGRPDALGWPA